MADTGISIDLNADLGEGGIHDAAMLALVSSANIACGGHTGDLHSMHTALLLARQHGVAIGAHPSFPDREHFGRKPMQMIEAQLLPLLIQQVRALQTLAHTLGLRLQHIKPHGALYNQAAFDPALGKVIIKLVQTIDPSIKLMALAGSPLVAQAKAAGLHVIQEAFADRRYRSDGSLVPRGELGAVIEQPAQAVTQSLQLIQSGSIVCRDGSTLALQADSLCVHGDGAEALQLLQQIRQALEGANIKIAPCRPTS